MALNKRQAVTQEAAEALAIQALSFIAGEPERLGRFLAITGIGPDRIRAAARESGFLVGVLDYLAADERLLTEFATEAGFPPELVEKARALLGANDWERDEP